MYNLLWCYLVLKYVFFGASQNNLCRYGGCGSKGSHVILEDLKHYVVTSQRTSSLP